MRKTLVSALCAFMLITGFGVITAPPAAAYSACPTSNWIVDWVNHQTCLANSDFTAENWQQGPYGVGWFARSAAYGYVPALCFYRTTKWVGHAGGGTTGFTHYFGVKEDQDGNCNGPWWNVPLNTDLTLSFFNVYGVEETLNMGYGLDPAIYCGTNATYVTDHAYASYGGQITGGSGDYQYDDGKCIPKIVGSDWKAGTYRAKQKVSVATFPYQEYTVYSDHYVYL